MISVKELCKSYDVPIREPGFRGLVRHWWNRKYKSISAVEKVSFEIQEGEFIGFLGPNGAGKTTTLKMLTGLLYPSAGLCKVAGFTPFERKADFLRSITLVMGQKQQLLWDLPAMDSLRLNAVVYEIEDAQFQSRVGRLREMLELEDVLSQPVRKMSLGERMKCELLAALLHEPKILFLDEPTLGLDVNAQIAVRDFLRDYNRETRATIVLTSHYMADITALCERVLIIHEGKLIHDGELESLTHKLSPKRELNLTMSGPVEASRLADFGELLGQEGASLRLLVNRSELKSVVARALSELPVVDLTVTDPPIEDLIARLFAGEEAAS